MISIDLQDYVFQISRRTLEKYEFFKNILDNCTELDKPIVIHRERRVAQCIFEYMIMDVPFHLNIPPKDITQEEWEQEIDYFFLPAMNFTTNAVIDLFTNVVDLGKMDRIVFLVCNSTSFDELFEELKPYLKLHSNKKFHSHELFETWFTKRSSNLIKNYQYAKKGIIKKK